MRPPEVITMGRIGVDLYPEQVGVPLAEVRSFSKSLGGSAANVAVAAARLGTAAAIVTKVGQDPFGEYLRAALREFGVDAGFVGTEPGLRTPLAFCEIRPPDRFPILFYREPTAPDMMLRPGELPLDAIRGARLFWTTGTGLSAEPSRSATLSALESREGEGAGALTVHDLDYRPSLWHSEEEARRLARRALGAASVVVGNLEEARMAVGEADPAAAAEALLGLGPNVAIVKRGAEGALARSASGELVEAPGVAVEVVNELGAGDAFGGALCHALVGGWELERALRFANAAGAIVASRRLCADDMPTLAEVEALLAGSVR